MCGFTILIDKKSIFNEDNLKSISNEMIELLNHRGPDSNGLVIKDNIAVSHARLEILDLNHGQQPMSDKDICMVFNGEIYNAESIRKKLENIGNIFHSSHSDTEVIFEGYKTWGNEIFHILEGMFSVCIIDFKNEKIVLSRDISGIKPLYFLNNNDFFSVSSEPKSFKKIPNTNIKINLKDQLPDYFKYRAPISPFTFLEDIWKLEPGKILSFSLKTYEKEIESLIPRKKLEPEKRKASNINNILSDSVKTHLISDVPIGTYLSGGVDSSIITVLAKKHGCNQAFTISTDSPLDEAKYAELVSKKFDINLNILKISGEEFLEGIDKWVYLNDDPVADPSALAMMLISDYAKKSGMKVMLSGEGADELFGGYNSHTRFLILKKFKYLRPFLKYIYKHDLRLKDYLDQDGLSYLGAAHTIDKKSLFQLLNYSDNKPLINRINQMYLENNLDNSMTKELLFDERIRLADDVLMRTDRATMGSSIECRVPFLDKNVISYASSLSDKYKFGYFNINRKKILKEYAIQLGIPKECVYRPKLGFELPIDHWLRGSLQSRVNTFLNKKQIEGINYDFIKTLLNNSNNNLSTSIVWHWFTLELWYESWA